MQHFSSYLCGFTIPSIRRHWRLEYCSNSSHLVLISFCSFEYFSLRTSTLFCKINIVEFCFFSFSLKFSICLFYSFINGVMFDSKSSFRSFTNFSFKSANLLLVLLTKSTSLWLILLVNIDITNLISKNKNCLV